MALRAISLFAGVGGLDLGASLARPTRCVCYVEREAYSAAILVTRMGDAFLAPAPVWSDVRTFDARPWRGRVHIIASGDPCQDNSVAGKRAGAEGERFLAPEVVRIAQQCRPDIIFRENVPGNAEGQLHAIVPPLERLGYRVAAGIFSSAETGNTMRRERLFIMASAMRPGRQQDAGSALSHEATHGSTGWNERQQDGDNVTSSYGANDAPGPVNGRWSDADWLFCRDGKWRPVEPGTFPLAHGTAARVGSRGPDWQTPAGAESQGHRVGRLRGYGNAINAEAAVAFIQTVMECRP